MIVFKYLYDMMHLFDPLVEEYAISKVSVKPLNTKLKLTD